MGALADAARNNRAAITTTIGPPAALSGLGMLLTGQYGDVVWQGSLGVSGTALLLAGACVRRRLPTGFSLGLGGFSLAALQAGVAGWSGLSLWTLGAWALNASALAIGYTIYRHKTRFDHLDKQIKASVADTRRTHAQMAHHRLMNMTSPAPETAPLLLGHTPEETAIRRAVFELYKKELRGAVVETTPHGWTALLDLPTGLEPTKLVKEWHRVANALALPGAFDPAPGGLSSQVLVKYLGSDPLADVVEYSPVDSDTFRDLVRIGRDAYGNVCQADLAYVHTLIAGTSKWGKSNLMKLLALRLAALSDVVLYGVDMKPGCPEFNLLRPILHDLAGTVEQVTALFDWLTQEMDERGEILSQHGDTTWIPEDHGRPAIFVLIDELGELARQGGSDLAEMLESKLALARGYGIHLIAATQTPSNRMFGKSTDARGNFTNRVGFMMAERQHYKFVFPGADWATNEFDVPGKFLIQGADHRRPVIYRAEFVSDTVCREEVARLGSMRVPAPIGKRAILPAPLGLSHQEAIRNRLKQYGEMTRRELETGTGLTEQQVLRACRAAAPEVLRDEGTGLWSLRPAQEWAENTL